MQALVIAGISLQAANLYGYILCKMGGDGDMRTVAASFLSQTVFQTVSDEFLPRTFLLGDREGHLHAVAVFNSLPIAFYCVCM
jgi:hypothetical protein